MSDIEEPTFTDPVEPVEDTPVEDSTPEPVEDTPVEDTPVEPDPVEPEPVEPEPVEPEPEPVEEENEPLTVEQKVDLLITILKDFSNVKGINYLKQRMAEL